MYPLPLVREPLQAYSSMILSDLQKGLKHHSVRVLGI